MKLDYHKDTLDRNVTIASAPLQEWWTTLTMLIQTGEVTINTISHKLVLTRKPIKVSQETEKCPFCDSLDMKGD